MLCGSHACMKSISFLHRNKKPLPKYIALAVWLEISAIV